MTNPQSNIPFVPSVRIRVGVTGHRKLAELSGEVVAGVRTRIEGALQAISEPVMASATEASQPQLVIVSSLAEGADRVVAECGLAVGYSLEAILPFGRREYEKDFSTATSREVFHQLLARSYSVFELDGDPRQRAYAYEAAGFVLLSNIDVLIAIWDGNEGKGRGGTAEVVERAVAEGIPVLWLNPDEAQVSSIYFAESASGPLKDARLTKLFRPIDLSQSSGLFTEILTPVLGVAASRSLAAYVAEPGAHNVSKWYRYWLLLLSFGRLKIEPIEIGSALRSARAEWADYLATLPPDKSQRPVIENVVLPAYAAADRLAVHFASAYRGAYTANFALAALAVTLALIGGLFFKALATKVFFVAGETLIAFLIVFAWRSGHRREWHRRWLEYRRIAECLRQIRVLAPLGLGGPIERSTGHLDLNAPDWASWYVHSIRRLIPLPDRAIDAHFLEAVRDSARRNEISAQISYHSVRAVRMHKYDHRLHSAGRWLFAATFLLCASFLPWAALVMSGTFPSPGDFWIASFTTATVLFPTIGAALSAIHAQGEFKTAAEQSTRIAKQLEAIDRTLANETPSFAQLADLLSRTTEAYMADVDDWHTVYRTRPLSLPA